MSFSLGRYFDVIVEINIVTFFHLFRIQDITNSLNDRYDCVHNLFCISLKVFKTIQI